MPRMTDAELTDLLRRNPDVTAPAVDTRTAPHRLTEAAQPCPSEHAEQAALFAWADAYRGQRPELALLFAIPNGGARHPAVGAQLRAAGVRAGVPDMMLAAPRLGRHGLFIEMKRSDRSNHATPEQTHWLTLLRQHGYMAVVCYGAQEAIGAIEAYLDGADTALTVPPPAPPVSDGALCELCHAREAVWYIIPLDGGQGVNCCAVCHTRQPADVLDLWRKRNAVQEVGE